MKLKSSSTKQRMLRVGTMTGVRKTGNVRHNSQTTAGSEKGKHVNDKQIDNSFKGVFMGPE